MKCLELKSVEKVQIEMKPDTVCIVKALASLGSINIAAGNLKLM